LLSRMSGACTTISIN